MLDTGRFCEADRDGDFVRMVAAGSPCPSHTRMERRQPWPHGAATWKPNSPDWDVILADEPWCFDPESGTAASRRVRASAGLPRALGGRTTGHARRGPASAAGVIDTMPVAVPRPLTTPIEHRRPKEIQPVLNLRRVSSADGLILDDPALSLVLGLPVFRYGDGAEFDPLEQGEDPVGKIRSKEKLVLIHRPVGHGGCRHRGTAGCRAGIPARGTGRHGPWPAALPCRVSHPGVIWTTPWHGSQWMNSRSTRGCWKKAGSSSRPRTPRSKCSRPAMISSPSNPAKGDGIDWFSFDSGVEAGGRRVSLLPAFAQAFEAQGEALLEMEPPEDEFMAIPIDESGRTYLRFPARRFVEMARHVFELFGGMPGGAVKLHRIEAAELASPRSCPGTAGGNRNPARPAPPGRRPARFPGSRARRSARRAASRRCAPTSSKASAGCNSSPATACTASSPTTWAWAKPCRPSRTSWPNSSTAAPTARRRWSSRPKAWCRTGRPRPSASRRDLQACWCCTAARAAQYFDNIPDVGSRHHVLRAGAARPRRAGRQQIPPRRCSTRRRTSKTRRPRRPRPCATRRPPPARA